jgi:4-diphosphocytidyl-2-C-methyl-D-erythritol kinase
MRGVSVKAYAKINLSLDILGRRPDGFHEIETVMQTVSLADDVTIERTGIQGGVTLETNMPSLPSDGRNLAHKAASFMLGQFGLDGGVFISVNKRIPVSAGLAGGSADCAAVLTGMNELFGVGAEKAKLAAFGARFGADVPFCVFGGTCLCRGTGADVEPLPPPPLFYAVLAKPDFAVSTAEIYAGLDALNGSGIARRGTKAVVEAVKNGDVFGAASAMGNGLEAVTVRNRPVIGDIKKSLLEAGAAAALMSGSGPAAFGLFTDEDTANKAASSVRKKFTNLAGVWVTKRHN